MMESPAPESQETTVLTVACIIPTLNAERYAARLGGALATQTLQPSELLIVDSASNDGTVAAYEQIGFRSISIAREAFNHGRVRNLGASNTTSDVLVFMTQDAIPSDANWLENLIAPLRSGEASAAFSRQLPTEADSPLAAFARLHNYPAAGRLVTPAHVPALGIKAAFFSNSCSAIRRDVFEKLGGFRTDTIMNEDMLFAAALLGEGHSHYYAADSAVLHSHDYTLTQTFRRYFDIGVVFVQAQDELRGFGAGSAGLGYVRSLLQYLWAEGKQLWIPKALAESAAKFVAMQLGKRYRSLPKEWVPRLSMHSGYWADG